MIGKKEIQKFMLSVLVSVMLFGALLPYVAQATFDEIPNIEIDLEDYEVKTRGLVMNPEEFNNAFSGEPKSRFMPFNLASTELTMHNIVIDGSNISLDLVLSPVSLFATIAYVEYSAYVTQLNGNQNDLTITVVEHFEGGWTNELSETFRIDNNGSGTFIVGNYEIFVNTQGNDQIREVRLVGDGSTVLSIEGTIFNGNRGENVFVIEIPDLVDGYEILLFEINPPSEISNLLLQSSHYYNLPELPHIKVYIMDELGQIHLFEMEKPEALTILDANNFEQLEEAYDLLWALGLANGVFEESETTDELLIELGVLVPSARGLNSFTLWAPNTFTYRFVLGNETHNSVSVPYVRRLHRNIGRGTSTWQNEFRVAEHSNTVVNGNVISTRHGTGVIRYRDIQFQQVVGARSMIESIQLQGRMNRVGGSAGQVGGTLFWRVLSHATNATAASILQNLRNAYLQNRSQTITLGNNFNQLGSGYTASAGHRLAQRYSLYRNTNSSNGHYLTMHTRVGPRGTTSGNTTGGMSIAFNVYDGGGARRVRSVRQEFSFTYNVNPQ